MPLSFRGLFVCVPFLRLEVINAQQNLAGQWVADYTPGALNNIVVEAYTTLGADVAWTIVSPGVVPVGAADPNDDTRFLIPLNNPVNIVDAANTLTVTATVGALVQTVQIVIRPVVTALQVVPNHYAFQDAANAWYGLDLTGVAVAPAANNITANLQVVTNPANAAAWSHVIWAAVNTAAGGAGYALTAVDGQTRGIRLDGVKTVQTSVGMLDTAQVMPAAVTLDVRAPLMVANLANGLGVELNDFTFAGAGYFGVTQEDAINFNLLYPAVWDRANQARPQAYAAANAFATNGIRLNVTASPVVGPTNVTVRASSYFPLAAGGLAVLQGTAGPVAVAAGTAINNLVAMGNIAPGAVPNEVMHNNPLMIFWEVSTDGGGTWAPLQLTANTVYVTAQAPVVTIDATLNNGGSVYTYDSLLAMSCDAAAGLAGGGGGAAAVKNAISGLFNPANPNPNVRRLNRAAGGGPTQLGYWLNHAIGWAPAQSINVGPPNLFTVATGNIACGVWADLLICLWALHGDGGGRLTEVVVRGPALGGLAGTANVVANSRFLVRNWDYNNHGNLNVGNYTHAIIGAVGAPLPPAGVADQAAPMTNGVAGQNNLNPPDSFMNHYIVRDGAGGNFVDPSYGTQALARNAWADASIGGLRNDTTGTAGFVQVAGGMPNGIQPNPAAIALQDFHTGGWVP